MRTTYILQCADDTLYTGITTDLDRRIYEHNHLSSGAKYTKARRPVTLLRSQSSPNRSTATSLEYQIKKMSKSEKYTLIASQVSVAI